jgi:hypothetical protein
VRFVRKLLLKCEERVRNGHRPRSCSVGGSESSETWDNGISLIRRAFTDEFKAETVDASGALSLTPKRMDLPPLQ